MTAAPGRLDATAANPTTGYAWVLSDRIIIYRELVDPMNRPGGWRIRL